MIRVTVYRRAADKTLKGLRVLGHAGYDEYGKDIVCAAVSALVTNLINSLEAFTEEDIVLRSEEADGRIEFKFRHPAGHDAVLLTDACILGLQTIEKEHAEYIRLLFREV